jgi:hypothetical protein
MKKPRASPKTFGRSSQTPGSEVSILCKKVPPSENSETYSVYETHTELYQNQAIIPFA